MPVASKIPEGVSDPRYCGEPKRHSITGDILRNKKLLRIFKEMNPLPSHLNPDDFEINHAKPIVCGGCDGWPMLGETKEQSINRGLANLLWMHRSAKSCAGLYCQDRTEQYTMCADGTFHK